MVRYSAWGASKDILVFKNCVDVNFGGKELKTLYVTALTSVYTVPMEIKGHLFALPSK